MIWAELTVLNISTPRACYPNEANPAPISENTSHQPNTIPSAVPRFTLLTVLNPMAVRTSVQIKKMSNEEARL